MKLYKRFKGMGKSTKVGLVSTAVYASTLALPAFANTLEQPVLQPIDIESLVDVEQAKIVYDQKLTEYAQDKKVTSQEIQGLHSIAAKGLSLEKKSFSRIEREFDEGYQGIYKELYEKISLLELEKEKLSSPVKKLEDKIKSENKELVQIEKESKNQNVIPGYKKQLEGIQEELNNILILYYPGLLKDTATDYNNLYYFAGKDLITEAKEQLYPLMEKADKILMETYQKDDIHDMLSRNLTLHDLITFRTILKSVQKIELSQKDYDKLRREKLDLIQKLNQQRDLAEKEIQPELRVLENKIRALEQEREGFYKKEKEERSKIQVSGSSFDMVKSFKSYLDRQDRINSFKKEYEKDLSRFISLSLFDIEETYDGSNEKIRSHNVLREELGDGKELITQLEDYFKNKGFDVSIVDKLHNPANPKFPLSWTLPFVLAIPVFRNLLILKYVSNGRAFPNDYLTDGPLIGGLAENIIFWGFVDACHPLVLPIRMAVIPLAWHGILKATGGDKRWYDYLR